MLGLDRRPVYLGAVLFVEGGGAEWEITMGLFSI